MCREALPHARRIPKHVLKKWTHELLDNASAIRRSRTFDALHEVVANGTVHGIGPLTVYDTATHIGAFLKLEPKRVYLHAGVRVGAKMFDPAHREWITMSELPLAFRQRLTAGETEDCLCLYKRQIEAIRRTSSSVLSLPRGC